jgi:ornithine cyclodeaminase/alanine dehydrogenase-like protein (mu-crystallin family)
MAKKLRFLSASDIRRALPMAEAVAVMKEVFSAVSRGQVVMPPRQHLEIAEHEGIVLFMPSYLPRQQCVGMKTITLFGRNPAAGLPRIQAMVLLFDAANGRPLAVLEGTVLTAIRTGAACGAATDLLARPDCHRVAMLGAGVQARTQLEAMRAVRTIRQVAIHDVSADRAAAFAAELEGEEALEVRVAAWPGQAVSEADIICAATTSATPVFDDSDLPPGVHINAIGSYQPGVQEIPAQTVRRARVVVDHRESALAETGDLIIPIRQGLFSADRIHAELGEIVAGLRPGRQSAEEVTFFKSVGLAAQDAAAGAAALKNAEALGLGTAVEL